MAGVYDYVVVGAGSAGAVVARRLIDAGATVALIEAGGPQDNPAIHDPGRSHELWYGPEDWCYKTVPQAGCAGRELDWPRGRVLGGSSALNGMIYIRGHRQDYDAWAYAGNAGWAWEDVLPAFKRSEDFDRGASEHHGAGGPLRVISDYEPHPVNAAMVQASIDAGIPFNPDHNGAELDGVGFNQLTIRDGRRETSYGCFVAPLGDEPRLTVLTGAPARALRFAGGRCVGVEVERDGAREVVGARAEVVVCAGAIGSPELLLRSGIGPAEELRMLGIESAVDLPGVGRNLHDHVLCPLIVSSPRPVPGLVAGLTELHSQLFWRSRPGLVAPDVQPLCFHVPLYDPSWQSGPADGYTLHAGLIRPASRGRMRLRSADPGDGVELDPRVLSREADVEALVSCLELCREIVHQPGLAEWTERELYPGPEARTRDELADYARRASITYHHQVGTCRMGIDDEAVVDPELRVYGVDGLRVADASIMPSVTSGNTNAPALMIGEKAATMILSAERGAALAPA